MGILAPTAASTRTKEGCVPSHGDGGASVNLSHLQYTPPPASPTSPVPLKWRRPGSLLNTSHRSWSCNRARRAMDSVPEGSWARMAGWPRRAFRSCSHTRSAWPPISGAGPSETKGKGCTPWLCLARLTAYRSTPGCAAATTSMQAVSVTRVVTQPSSRTTSRPSGAGVSCEGPAACSDAFTASIWKTRRHGASRHIASRRITSHRITPHHAASRRITPHHASPSSPTPHNTRSHARTLTRPTRTHCCHAPTRAPLRGCRSGACS